MADNAYKEYEKKLYSYTDNTLLTEEIVNGLFNELLTVLPNKGKLYKYKALSTFHIDELEEKYIWFSSAKKLNDKKDCTFNANSLKEMEPMVKFFLTDDNYRKTLVNGYYLQLLPKCPEITPKAIEDCLSCVTKNGQRIGKLKFDNFCKKYKLTSEEKQELVKTIQLYSDKAQNEGVIRNSVSNLHKQMQEVRNSMQVCSLTTSYDKDSMWAYYCNNQGVCIEYDFTKINDYELKKKFINTQKVRYGKKKKFSYINIIKAKLENTQEAIAKADELIISQLLTKEKSWRAEEEWRTIGNVSGNETGIKVYADIVSAIYIDYSILNEEKTKRIIEIARQNKWNIYVRYFNQLDAEYKYDTIENINDLIARQKDFFGEL